MLENNYVFSVNHMLFNLRYWFNASEQASCYLLPSDVCVQVGQIWADSVHCTVFNISW